MTIKTKIDAKIESPLGVIFFADCWDIQWRRRQQIAYRLAQSDYVKYLIYVEKPLPITSLLKFIVSKADLDGMHRWRRVFANRSLLMTVNKKLSVLASISPLPEIKYTYLFKASEKIRHLWLIAKLNYLRQKFAMDRLLVWVSLPHVHLQTIRALQPDILWYDCTEDFSAESSFPTCLRNQIMDVDRYLTKTADVVTTVSRILYREKLGINPNTYWMPNAVDTDIFWRTEQTFNLPAELHMVKRPILTFVGGVDELSHDWQLLDTVAALRPEWTILLIGHIDVSSETKLMLQHHPGIICVGQKPYEKLPEYLFYSDVCIMFYRQVRRNTTRNSQKLFLYLASGKPVVSTRAADVDNYLDYVYLANTPQEFVAAVEKALSAHSPEKMQACRKIAIQNSWEARVEEVENILVKTMSHRQ